LISSFFSVAKKLSATALSKQSPLLPIDWLRNDCDDTPSSRASCATERPLPRRSLTASERNSNEYGGIFWHQQTSFPTEPTESERVHQSGGTPIDYRAADGRQGPRRVEPYSLRQTRDGNLILFVVNGRGELRGYRSDRIAGVRPTDETFRPRYLAEF
jgi:hypothetical protein